MVIVGPGIVAASILYHLADGAAAPWHIPDAASDLVEEDSFVDSCKQAFQSVVAAIDDGEETIGTSLAAEEHTIET